MVHTEEASGQAQAPESDRSQPACRHKEREDELTLISVPHGEHPEDEGTEGGSEEPSPVVPDSEERGRDLDAEEDAWGRRAVAQEWRGARR